MKGCLFASDNMQEYTQVFIDSLQERGEREDSLSVVAEVVAMTVNAVTENDPDFEGYCQENLHSKIIN